MTLQGLQIFLTGDDPPLSHFIKLFIEANKNVDPKQWKSDREIDIYVIGK